MKRKAEITFLFSLVFIITMCCSAATVSAAPEDYINGFIDGISSAIDGFRDNNRDNNGSSSSSEISTVPTEAPTVSSEISPDYDDYDTEDYTDYPYYSFENFATEPEDETEPPYEEASSEYDEDEPDENYEYSYEPPTEEETEVLYEPEILTETYTDPPFLERFSIADTGEGNLFVALGLWMSILIGIIIVTSVVISTHRRKKGK